MNPAQKALWYVESHLADSLTLDEIAAVDGVSRFHMVRSFAEATGMSVMRYVRARRLTKAARALARGAPDILTLALEADYGSHEAFTRAFREQFGSDDGVDRVRSDRDERATGQERPRVPGGTLPGKSDDGDSRDDDDAVHDQRPRPRLPRPDPGASGQIGQRRERQPEGSGGDEHRPGDRRHGGPAPPVRFTPHSPALPRAEDGGFSARPNHRSALWLRPPDAGWVAR